MIDRLVGNLRRITVRRGSGDHRTKNWSPLNYQDRRLTTRGIAAKKHRAWVGGLWDEVGALQFEFLKMNGLSPQHRLLDIGCGALRGGLHFVRHLERGNYYGLDVNPSLIEAGRWELVEAGLSDREPTLIVDDRFNMGRFGVSFDYAIAISVFTHLHLNEIAGCLVQTKKVLKPSGKLFASFFEAPSPLWLEPITHEPGGVVSAFDADPFHLALAEIEWVASLAGLITECIGDWGHPRNQQMLCFSRAPEA